MYSGNSYKNFPVLYDLLYQRYLKSIPDFVALVEKSTPKHGAILDLAAGTGEVTIPLLQKGFSVQSLDASRGMLGVLVAKAKKLGVKKFSVTVGDMCRLLYREQFDAVCIRQAINYFMGTKELGAGLAKIHTSLKAGGKFVFNAPNYHGEKKYPTVFHQYEKGKQRAAVLETNTLRGRVLRHKQYSLVWASAREPEFVTDENTFYLFTKKEFAHALKRGGFSSWKFGGSDKTLYCIATK